MSLQTAHRIRDPFILGAAVVAIFASEPATGSPSASTSHGVVVLTTSYNDEGEDYSSSDGSGYTGESDTGSSEGTGEYGSTDSGSSEDTYNYAPEGNSGPSAGAPQDGSDPVVEPEPFTEPAPSPQGPNTLVIGSEPLNPPVPNRPGPGTIVMQPEPNGPAVSAGPMGQDIAQLGFDRAARAQSLVELRSRGSLPGGRCSAPRSDQAGKAQGERDDSPATFNV